MWTQIVGKIRLALTPLENHWWNTALYVNTRGLTTSPIPYHGGAFEIQFDFVNHRLEIRTGRGIDPSRSEEHTSELQSHLNLVCRLLLEKKKNMIILNEYCHVVFFHVNTICFRCARLRYR